MRSPRSQRASHRQRIATTGIVGSLNSSAPAPRTSKNGCPGNRGSCVCVCVRSVDNLMTLYAQVEQHRKLPKLHQAGIKDLQTRRRKLLPTRPQRLKRTTHTDSYLQRIQSVQTHCWPNWPLRKQATAMHSPCLSPPKGQEQHLPQPEQGPQGINIQEPLVKYLLLQQSNLKTIGLVEIIVAQIETTPHVCRTHAR